MAKPSGDYIPLSGFVLLMRQSSMPTLRETLQPRRDIERRAVGRTTINRDASLFFMGQESVHVVGRACRSLRESLRHRNARLYAPAAHEVRQPAQGLLTTAPIHRSGSGEPYGCDRPASAIRPVWLNFKLRRRSCGKFYRLWRSAGRASGHRAPLGVSPLTREWLNC